MLSLNAYIFLSFLVPVVFVLDYANAYREYFTTVVELTNSSLFRLLFVNVFIASTFLFWLVACRVFFGKLNHTETELLRNSVPLYIAECVVGPFYFGVSVLGPFGVAALFTVVLALLHGVARERTTTLHVVESPAERLRMLSGLTLFFLVAMPLDLYVVFDVFVNTARERDEYLTLKYSAAIMYLQFAISNLNFLVRLLFTEVIGESDHGPLAFYAELFFSLLKSSVFIVSFTYVCIVSQAPFPLLRVLINSAVDVVKKIQSLVTYISLTRFVHSIKNASEDILARDSCCAICQDEMKVEQNCKQLPCGHCYHEHCLRRWFEGMSTCPYCRADLLKHMRKANRSVHFIIFRHRRRNAGNNENINNRSNNNNNNNNNSNNNNAATSSAAPPSFTREGNAVTDTLRNSAYEQLTPSEEEEILKAYAQYCDARIHAASRGTGTSNQTGEQLRESADSTNILSYLISPRGEDDMHESPVFAANGGSNDSRTDGGARERESLKEGTPFDLIKRSKDLQKLDAYEEYEEAIRRASQTLRRRLLAIESSS
ncbi:hypothetical protein MOQ_005780 [Trypanosoma cruzi marinkellei]|uniref:RING-type domain-containing protein n=1 Tax=Trypanosoma cruzi marinkellei TaxID=85056 RepID=K2MX97_TRYCR|nr:hypothetical protein MOQ_005780 [Trypanosoma cruzi marinkellei]